MSDSAKFQTVVLVILDGWGIGPAYEGNAVERADTPNMDRIVSEYPNTLLSTSAHDVGLPEGQMGNSEVGHLNIGAGFVVDQSITKIDKAIEDGSLLENQVLIETIDGVISRGGNLHFVGLVSDGGVHSHTRHLIALLELAKHRGIDMPIVHAVTDGRDTPPDSGINFVGELEREMSDREFGRIATVSGRYYAMDRDNRWERTHRAYDAIVSGKGTAFPTARSAIEAAYSDGTTDEFIEPAVIAGSSESTREIQSEDAIIFFNFRADRGRQLAEAFANPTFSEFARPERVQNGIRQTTLTEYDGGIQAKVAFAQRHIENPLARVVSDAGLRQFHAAETEKYAHVTYFLNGGREEPFPGEDRRLEASPKVATYDLQPEMSAAGVTEHVLEAILPEKYAWIIVNYANGDMVGHTGDIEASITAIETVDTYLAGILDAASRHSAIVLVTADHGNCEEMIDRETGAILTAHTTNPVPFVLVAPDGHESRYATLRRDGILSAIAPTTLELIGLDIPDEMTTPSLIDHERAE